MGSYFPVGSFMGAKCAHMDIVAAQKIMVHSPVDKKADKYIDKYIDSTCYD